MSQVITKRVRLSRRIFLKGLTAAQSRPLGAPATDPASDQVTDRVTEAPRPQGPGEEKR